ncbi:MAG: biotin transporter BioY [Gemmatimonadetes bacterium]|nr:biotin transporter BioY [Gemmatimonadota bacterium]NNK48091.1 biotin transporter BioY [Gemmatimonadota bacterium]
MSREAVRSVNPAVAGVRSPAVVLGVLGFAALTALGARLSVPLPGLVIPMTLQPVAVLLAGAVLGSRAGAASQVLYLAAGAAGLPVFAAGGGAAYLLGPTGGYLLAFPAAAAVAGLAGKRSSTWPRAALWLGLALVVIHLGGIAWLSIIGGESLNASSLLRPFILGDALKVLLVLAVVRWGPGILRRPTS